MKLGDYFLNGIDFFSSNNLATTTKSTRHAKNIFQPFFNFRPLFFCSLRIYAFKEKKRKVHLHSLWKKKLILYQKEILRGRSGWLKKKCTAAAEGEQFSFFYHSTSFFYKLKTKMTATIFSFQSFKLHETRQFFDTKKNHFFKSF